MSLVLVAAQVLLYSGTGSSSQAPSSAAQQALAEEEAVAEYCRAVVGWTLSHVHALRCAPPACICSNLASYLPLVYPSASALHPSPAACCYLSVSPRHSTPAGIRILVSLS